MMVENKNINDVEFKMMFSKEAENDYNLMIVVGNNSIKKRILKIQEIEEYIKINLNFELSRILINSTKNEVMDPVSLIEKIIEKKGEKIFLTDINVLFDSNLKWDPLKILKKLSEKYCLLVFWEGKIDGKFLTYAIKEHKEFVEFPEPKDEGILIKEMAH